MFADELNLFPNQGGQGQTEGKRRVQREEQELKEFDMCLIRSGEWRMNAQEVVNTRPSGAAGGGADPLVGQQG